MDFSWVIPAAGQVIEHKDSIRSFLQAFQDFLFVNRFVITKLTLSRVVVKFPMS